MWKKKTNVFSVIKKKVFSQITEIKIVMIIVKTRSNFMWKKRRTYFQSSKKEVFSQITEIVMIIVKTRSNFMWKKKTISIIKKSILPKNNY